MGVLDGRVAIVTGAGRGIGRAYALLFASEGARVVVNDAGVTLDGASTEDLGVAQLVVDEIRARGGEAVASTHDISAWEGAGHLVGAALDAFGDLHVLVNNAGILRDRMLVHTSEADFDAVVGVQLKGQFALVHHAARYWRQRSQDGTEVTAAIVNTTAMSGLFANPGQASNGAAAAGVAALTVIASRELGRYGIRVNAIAPSARTRITEAGLGLADIVRAPADAARFDVWDPANVAPLAAALATRDCPVTGKVFSVQGDAVAELTGWSHAGPLEHQGPWSVGELCEALAALGARAAHRARVAPGAPEEAATS